MIKRTTPFEIPNEMRAVVEQSVEQAKLLFNNYIQAAQEAASTFEQWVKASQTGAQGISKKAMSFAERNVLSAFEFAQKIVQAKDIQEFVRMQTEFVQSQIEVLSEQVMDDEHVSTLETLTPNDNRRLPTPRVKRIMNPPAVALIPGSMSLLRPQSRTITSQWEQLAPSKRSTRSTNSKG